MATSQAATTSSDNAGNLQELQETVSRLSSHKGVKAVLILNRAGDILVESGPQGNPQNAKYVKQLMDMATSYLLTLSPDDEVSFLQIRSTQHRELMIAPHEGFVLAVLKH